MPSLLRLLRASLRPYAGYVALVVSLLLIQSIANLYLPNLNADIINNGVVKGDVGYIWRIGAIMLVLAVFVGILSIVARSEEHTSELQSRVDLVCRLLLE